jgi:cytochrome c biogenesis protein CcmG, thiol:disulfide interchange protein DsbE
MGYVGRPSRSTSGLRGARPAPRRRRYSRRGGIAGASAGGSFLGLDIQDVRGDARSFLSEHGVTYPTIRDPRKDVTTDFGATGIPVTYFVSGSGRVIAHVVGVVSERQVGTWVVSALIGRVGW